MSLSIYHLQVEIYCFYILYLGPSSPNTRAAYETYLMTLPKFKQDVVDAPATVDFARPVTYESYLSLIPAFKKTDANVKQQEQTPADPYKSYLSMIPHFAAKATGDNKAAKDEPLSYEAYTKLMPRFAKTPPPSPTSFDSQGYVAMMPAFINATEQKKQSGTTATVQQPSILSSYELYLKTLPSFGSRTTDAEVASLS